MDGVIARLEEERWVPDAETRDRLTTAEVDLQRPATSAELLRRPETDASALLSMSRCVSDLDDVDRRIVAETIMYAGYVERQQREAQRIRNAGARRIPDDFVYQGLPGLSHELVEKLEKVRPERLGRAARIDGMTPAALALLAAHLESRPERRAR